MCTMNDFLEKNFERTNTFFTDFVNVPDDVVLHPIANIDEV